MEPIAVAARQVGAAPRGFRARGKAMRVSGQWAVVGVFVVAGCGPLSNSGQQVASDGGEGGSSPFSGATGGTSSGGGTMSSSSGSSGDDEAGTEPGSGDDGGSQSSSGDDASDGATGTPVGPPALTVSGNLIKDPGGNTVVLRGVDIPDLGLLATSPGGVMARIDHILSTSNPALDSKAVRMPVYPETCFNSGSPYYSPEPYPVGTPGPASSKQTIPSSADYISTVLKPAVDYATSKGLYVIIDYHQIDNVTTGTSGTDAVTFWTAIAPVFASYTNVLYEAFNEPIDSSIAGGYNQAFQTVAQSWVNAIRSGAPKNVIVVGSPSWSQHPEGAIKYPLTGGNLVFTAHIYPGNFPGKANAFQNNVATAIAQVPVFITEWGYQIGTASPYNNLLTPDDTWVRSLQSFVNGNGASWTAWVADPSWGPPMFTEADGGASTYGLTDFGTFVQNWLANP